MRVTLVAKPFSTTTKDMKVLLALYGVLSSFVDGEGQRHRAGRETLERLLRGLGVETEGKDWQARALRQRTQALLERGAAAPAVAWDGQRVQASLWAGQDAPLGQLHGEVLLENGPAQGMAFTVKKRDPAGEHLHRVTLTAVSRPRIPLGLHQLRLTVGAREVCLPLIAAPRRCPALLVPQGQRGRWGVFAPVHALYREEAPALGTYSDLAVLAERLSRHGAGALAVLPLLPCYLDGPVEPSPYAPVSRLFWSDVWVDPTASPQWSGCEEAQKLLAQGGADAAGGLVDFQAAYARRRKILTALSETFRGGDDDYQRFLATHPQVNDYALFRACTEGQGGLWPTWPDALQRGSLREDAVPPQALRYHRYTQWLAHRQMAALKDTAQQQDVLLAMDLPVGVHSGGYDTWRFRGAFARGVSVGAPPDAFFHQGQDWGFPPLLPDSSLGEGLTYLARCLDHHLAAGGLLRVDHVMGLERLYWIPQGLSAKEGAYVCAPLEALTALVCLKAHEHGCAVQGENLGTVSPRMNKALARHGLYGSHVLPFQQGGGGPAPFRAPSDAVVASLGTHDMPPLRGYLQARDIGVLEGAGLCTQEQSQQFRQGREHFATALAALPTPEAAQGETDPQAALWFKGLHWLGKSDAPLVVVNAEDLWLATEPQNVPGLDSRYYPSWRRRFALSLEAMTHHPRLAAVAQLFAARQRGRN